MGKGYNVKLSKLRLLIIIGVVITVISGCVSHKSPPAIIHADNYTAETLKKQQVLPPAERVLGLKEAIRIGLTNNPTYKQKHLAIVSAWATFYSQLATYSPTLSANFGATQTPMFPSALGGQGSNTTLYTNWNAGLAASWKLFDGLQRTMNVLSARYDALNVEALERDYRRALIYNLTQAYNAILLQRAQIQIDLSDVAFNEQQLRDARLKYSAGAESLSKLLNFKINKAAAQNKIIRDTAYYQTYRYALAALMGFTTSDLPEDTQFPEIEVSSSEEFSLGVEFYIDMAIAQRPDLKATRLKLDSLKYKLYSRWGAFSPEIDLTMNYGFNRREFNKMGSFYPRGEDLLYNYGFAMSWDLWEGGARIANVRKAQADLDSQEEGLMDKWITIVKEVRSAYTDLFKNTAQRKLLAKIMTMTQKRRDLVREEYNAGNTDIANLNQAQNNLVGAESAHIKSVIEVSNSRAKLLEACGSNIFK